MARKAIDVREVLCSGITVGTRYRKAMGNLQVLAESIRKLGLMQPIGITTERKLLFGERRLRAVSEVLEQEMILARVFDLDALQAEHDENECRLALATSEKVALAKALREAAGERRGRPEESDKRGGENIVLPGAQLNPDDGEKTSGAAARKAGLGSRHTLERAETVVDNGTPELIASMDAGEIPIKVAARAAALSPEQQQKVVEEVKKGRKPKKVVEEVEAEQPPEPNAEGPAHETNPETPTAAPPLVDAEGLPLEGSKVEAFAALERFRDAEKLLRQAQKIIGDLAILPGAEFLRLELVCKASGDKVRHSCEHIKNAIAKLAWAEPHAAFCPYCHHAGKVDRNCRACHGLDYVTKHLWKQSPEDYRTALLRERKVES